MTLTRPRPLFVLTLLLLGCLVAPLRGDAPQPTTAPVGARPVLDVYRERLELVRRNIPQITKAAETAAARWVERRQVLFHFPFGGDGNNFSMEFTSRAGGLDNFGLNTVRLDERGADDVVVYGLRSWELGGKFLKADVPKNHEAGWLIVVFGSRAGAPKDLPIDILIDNFAASGDEDEAAVNAAINLTNGWLWTCELTAALTRRGVHPGILHGMPLVGSTAHNEQFQTGKPTLYPCEKSIPAGELAAVYLRELEKILADLDSPDRRAEIARAADLAVKHLKAGKNVWACSFTHALDGETGLTNRSPFKRFNGISAGPNGEEFSNNVKEGDLLFWFGEWTLNMPWTDYLAYIRRTKANYVPSFRPFPAPREPWDSVKVFYDYEVGDAAAVIHQDWPVENAVVEVPFPPGKMAPVSGVYVTLLYRLLDDETASRLTASAGR